LEHHPDALGRGIGKLIATGLEDDAARRRARRIKTHALFRASPLAARRAWALRSSATRLGAFSSNSHEQGPPLGVDEWTGGGIAFDLEVRTARALVWQDPSCLTSKEGGNDVHHAGLFRP
jgi:hypothetical protein